VEELLGVLPLVERPALVEAFVALEADERPAGGARERDGELRLADARRALDQDGLLQALGEEDRGGDLPGREVAGLAELLLDGGNVLEGADRHAAAMKHPAGDPSIRAHTRPRSIRTRIGSPSIAVTEAKVPSPTREKWRPTRVGPTCIPWIRTWSSHGGSWGFCTWSVRRGASGKSPRLARSRRK